MNLEKNIYLDYAAATPLDSEAQTAMRPFFSDIFANPSSLHADGRRARKLLEQARKNTAGIIHCRPEEIIFTSGGTESNNLAIQGIAHAHTNQGKHIITTNIEHSSVLKVCQDLERQGWHVTYLPVNNKGLVTARQVEEAVTHETRLITIHYVNNEIGVVQPIPTISQRIKKQWPNVILHTDACQAGNFFDLQLRKIGVDALTLTGGKIYGPKGTGLLIVKKNIPIKKLWYGGDQENNIRPGTENMAAIIGFSQAFKKTASLRQQEFRRQSALQKYFIQEIKKMKGVQLNGDELRRSPHIVHFSVTGLDTNSLLMYFDQKHMSVSGGSACQAGSFEPSHVIGALSSQAAEQANIRVSMGRNTTKKELEMALKVLKQALIELKGLSPNTLSSRNF